MAFVAPFIPAIIGVAGGVVSAMGTLYQGQAQAGALNYQAEVAQRNAIMAEQNAAYAIEAGHAKTAAKSMEVAAQGGAVTTALAAGGVNVNTGSAKDVRQSQRELGKLDTEQTMTDAQLQARRFREQGYGYQAQAGLYGYEAPQAITGAELGAAGTVLGSAAKWLSPPASSPSNFVPTYGGAGDYGVPTV